MLRLLRLFISASAAALILAAAPGGHAFVAPANAQAEAMFTSSVAPPLLPTYSQPSIPGPGYMWIPGYWAWDSAGYYWVPASWARPPAANLLWTPGYWAWDSSNNDYVYFSGYWAPRAGYYGGINYGFGYTGEGYHGGYWRNGQFVYNRAVNDLGSAHVASYANQAFAFANHVSFNGGRGGTTARPTREQLAMMRERHIGPTPPQIQDWVTASRIPTQRYSENRGSPPITAVARADDFRGANTSLPLAHTVAGARPNGPFINAPERGPAAARPVPNGPIAATGTVANFAQHPVAIRSPTVRPKVAPRPTPP